MNHEISLEDYILAGGKLSSPANANARYRGEIMRLMAIFVDSEMAGASGFADCINMAPGLKERMLAARIVQEKFGHAQRVLKLMEEFGANTSRYILQHPWAERRGRDTDLGTRRIDGDMRLNVFHYPVQNWCDAVIMNTLMGSATLVQLEELRHCSYQPLADAMGEIIAAERRHAQWGMAGLRQLLAKGYDKSIVQDSLDYWYPRVAASFGRSDTDRFETYRKFALRQHDNEQLRKRWSSTLCPQLKKLGLSPTP